MMQISLRPGALICSRRLKQISKTSLRLTMGGPWEESRCNCWAPVADSLTLRYVRTIQGIEADTWLDVNAYVGPVMGRTSQSNEFWCNGDAVVTADRSSESGQRIRLVL